MRLAPARVQAAADRRADALASSGDQHDPALHAALPDYTIDLFESNTPTAVPHRGGILRRAFRSTVTDLPEPDAAARAHSERVAAHLRAAIADGGGPHPVLALHGARALCARPRLLRGRGAKARRCRRFRHRARNDAAVRDGARDAGGGDPRGDANAGRSSSSAAAAAGSPPICWSRWPRATRCRRATRYSKSARTSRNASGRRSPATFRRISIASRG